MPIDRSEFESDDTLSIRPGTNKHRILTFLAANEDTAFTRSEVAEGAGVDPDSTGPVLVRLREEGLVEHRDRYWTIERDERLGVLESILEEVDDLADRFDVDDLPDWVRG